MQSHGWLKPVPLPESRGHSAGCNLPFPH
jgi:hypothetical protein